MELSDVAGALRRRWLVVAATVTIAMVSALAVTLRPGLAVTASATLLVEPTAYAEPSPAAAVRKQSVTIAQVVSTGRFHAEVLDQVGPSHDGQVRLTAVASPATGSVVISGSGRDASAAVAFVNAAARLARQGVGGSGAATTVVSIREGAINSKAGEQATVFSALALGIVLGVLIALALEGLANGSSARRVARRHGVTVLAEIPLVRIGDLVPSRVFANDAGPAAASVREAFETAQVRLGIRLNGETERTIAVVSRSAGEGRSTVAENLAWLCAATVAPVSSIRVDAGSLHQRDLAATERPSPGAGRAGHPKGQDPVQFGGTVSIVRMDASTAVEALANRHRAVIVDAPAMKTSRESVLIAAAAGRALVVVDLRRRQLGKLTETVSDLEAAGVEVAGVILNKVPRRYRHHSVTWTRSNPSVRNDGARIDGAQIDEVTADNRPRSSRALPERLLHNTLGTYGAVVVAGISALVVTPIVVHHLGKDAFGVYSLVAQMSGYLLLLNLGFGTSTVKLIAEDAGKRPKQVIETFNVSFFALSVLAVFAAVLGLIVGLLLPTLFKIPAPLQHDSVIAFELLAIAFAASIPATAIVGVVMGYQRYDLEGIIDMVGITSVGIAIATVAVLTRSLLAVAIVTASQTVLLNVLQWYVARRLVPGLHISPRGLDRSRLRRTTALSGWYLLQNVSATLTTETDLLVVGALFGVKDVALFAIGLQLALLGDRAITPFARVFFPHVSALSVEESPADALRAVLWDGTRTVLAIATPVCLTLILLAGPAIKAWVGGSFSTAAGIVAVLAGVSLAQSAATVATQVMIGMGRAKAGSYIGACTAVVNLVSSVLLGRALGLVGVAIGSLVAVGLVFVPATVIFAGRLIDASILTWVRKAVFPNLIPAGVAIACLLGLRSIGGSSPLVVIGGAIGTWLASGVTYVLVGASVEERDHLTRLLGRVASLVKRT